MYGMKIIIAGGRDFNNYELLQREVAKVMIDIHADDYQIVSGCAPGADKLGERFAEEMGVKVVRFPAQWQKFGNAAGPIRNAEMANYANMLIAFWDGKSRGTKHMIEYAKTRGMVVKVISY